MALELFTQGPMTEAEAIALQKRYRAEGRRVSVTDSFHPGLKSVHVFLPSLKYAPRPSRNYQQKIWK